MKYEYTRRLSSSGVQSDQSGSGTSVKTIFRAGISSPEIRDRSADGRPVVEIDAVTGSKPSTLEIWRRSLQGKGVSVNTKSSTPCREVYASIFFNKICLLSRQGSK